MGLFNFLKKRGSPTTEQATTEQATTHVRDIKDPLLEALISGQTITREQAITLPAVAGAVDFISNIIASMPVKLYKHKQGKVEELPKDTVVAWDVKALMHENTAVATKILMGAPFWDLSQGAFLLNPLV